MELLGDTELDGEIELLIDDDGEIELDGDTELEIELDGETDALGDID